MCFVCVVFFIISFFFVPSTILCVFICTLDALKTNSQKSLQLKQTKQSIEFMTHPNF